MGVSFKVSKNGTRFRPKPFQFETSSVVDEDVDETSEESGRILANNESTSTSTRNLVADIADGNEDAAAVNDNEISFTLNLFPDGYSIGKPSENGIEHQTTVQDVPKFLQTYDRTSETLFSAIESGRLPGDILDDIPCKYIDGTLVCEVRDYRKCASQPGINGPSVDNTPIINKVRLRMSLENVVKDMPLISDNAWTYGDLMEVESRILKALQPQLCLDPTPKLDRLCDNSVSSKLNFSLSSMRRKRLRQMAEVNVTSYNKIHGKKVCIDRVSESSNCRLGDLGTTMQQPVHEKLTTQNVVPSNMPAIRPKIFASDASVLASSLVSHESKHQMGVGDPRIMQDHGSGPVLNAPGASPAGKYMTNPNTNKVNSIVSSVHGKRENQDGELSPLSNLNKRARLIPVGLDGSQQQHIGLHMDNFHGSDSHWKNTLLQQQSHARGFQYANTSTQKYPQQMFEGGFHQEAGAMPFTGGPQGIRYGSKEEPVEAEKLDKPELGRYKTEMYMKETEINHMDSQQSRLQQRLPQQFMRSSFYQTPWNSLGQPLENNFRKEDQIQKRKLVQSPRVSGGGLPQSPLSSKSGEFSSGSIGPQFGAVATIAAHGSSQKEKLAATSVHEIAGPTSLTSSANDPMQWQHQAQTSVKRRTNSLPITPAMSGVGSPASVSNMGVPLNASSPTFGTPPLAEQIMLERLSKIEEVSVRFQLNCKKNKADEFSKKPNTYPTQQLMLHLSNDSNSENFKDETCKMPLSNSLVGGSMNICKTRVLNFVQTESILQGNGFSPVPKVRTRMIMSEKPNDGTVAMHYGEIEDGDYLAVEEYLPTLPNTMIREGYIVEDHVQAKPIHMNRASSSQSNARGITPNTAVGMQQNLEPGLAQSSNEVAKPSNSDNTSLNSSQNIPGTRMLPPGNVPALQISQGLLLGVSMPSRSQQPELQPSLQQQQQQLHQKQHSLMQHQRHQFQRSPLMLAANPLSHLNTMGQNSNMPLGNHMVNQASSLQRHMIQQQQQQQPLQQLEQQQPLQQLQQQTQMQRKMMMGLGTTVGMGNIGNMVGLQGLGNAMGMGIAGRTGISASMGPISGIGNVGQNPKNLSSQASNISNTLSQQLRSGALTQQQVALMATKFRMAQNRTNMLAGAQSSIGGMSGARQMHPRSTSLSMLGSSLNQANINSMQQTATGPMGPPKLMTNMNIYMNQQQLQLQQKQLQLQQQQQQTTLPLQAVVSPQQVGSPSTMGIPQQLNQQSQQQQQQSSPQQMSQRTPMSPPLNSGANHPMTAGNQETCPASPQLSSQTLGSVASLPHSPMDLQGVNKSSSVENS